MKPDSGSAVAPPTSAGAGVTLRVGPAADLHAELEDGRGRVMLAVRYGDADPGLRDAGHPFLDVPNPVLHGAPPIEIWSTPRRATCSRRGDLAWAEDGRALLGCLSHSTGADVEETTLETYRELLALLDERGYPGLQRVWNYVPRINEDQLGLERYKRFNKGRARAFDERFGPAAERHFSAASAVGTEGDRLLVCFAAGRERGTHLDNPRQVSPPRYPRSYGPQSPSFVRGTFAPSGWGKAFFLSGTASVVGHATMHRGDPLGQLEELLVNIRTLLRGARAGNGYWRPEVGAFDLLKIYVRHREHVASIRSALERRFDPAPPAIYLMADLCRADLLLEIEGVSLPKPGASESRPAR